MPCMIHAEEKNFSNTISISSGLPYMPDDSNIPNIDYMTINYERLFLGDHLGISSGFGYNYAFRKSFFIPVLVKYIPFNTFFKPDIYFGGVFAYNRMENDSNYEKKDAFDKGIDACFESGLGLTVSPLFSCISFGVRVHAYTDFQGSTSGLIAIEAGYMF